MLRKEYGNRNFIGNAVEICGAYLLVLVIVLIAYKVYGYAPFGDVSLVNNDAYYQYLDFFAYYKDLLEGRQSLLFSFTTGMGNANLALFMYYLSSPFNLIVVFFEKSQLHRFFDILIALKIAMCGATSYWYIKKRFAKKINIFFVYALSVSYALMQYNIAQASNIMWLDGVYMLPLMLWGIYKIVNDEGNSYFSIVVCIAIMLNWYTAGINCIFTVMWFWVEATIAKNISIKDKVKSFVKYAGLGLVGVAMSSALFLPTVYYLTKTPRGTADVERFKFRFNGNPFSVITGYAMGAESTKVELSIFAGGLILAGVFGFFTGKKIARLVKLITGIVLFVTIMGAYFQPLYFVFSLFQEATSYYFRFSYLSIFTMLFMASFFLASEGGYSNAAFVGVNLIYSAILIVYERSIEDIGIRNFSLTVIFQILLMILIITFFKIKKRALTILVILSVSTLTLIEMFINTGVLIKRYQSFENVSVFETYEEANQNLIDEIKRRDTSSAYRIAQTSYRAGTLNSVASLNEGMAFNYWGMESYTSVPDQNYIDFMRKIGYRVDYDRLVEKIMPIIPIDSLLGNRYIVSSTPYYCFELIDDGLKGNNKSAYYNPYNMPMAFLIERAESFNEPTDRPMKYQNELLEYTTGVDNIITKIKPDLTGTGNTKYYSFSIPDGNFALYGNIRYKSRPGGTLSLNGETLISYGTKHSLKYFYVPVKTGEKEAFVQLDSENIESYNKAYFYLVDLDKLKLASENAWNNKPEDLQISEKGGLSCHVNAKEGQGLFTSIPYVRGWDIRVNGEKIVPNLVQDYLVLIPLKEGDNEIRMVYHIPFFIEGIIISVISLAVVVICQAFSGSHRGEDLIKK